MGLPCGFTVSIPAYSHLHPATFSLILVLIARLLPLRMFLDVVLVVQLCSLFILSLSLCLNRQILVA